jgi:hypothetical protein
MSPFLLRLNVRATAYRAALNEIAQLPARHANNPVGLTDTIRHLAGDLHHSRASRLQLVITDPFLRNEIGQQLQQLRPKTPRDFQLVCGTHPRNTG